MDVTFWNVEVFFSNFIPRVEFGILRSFMNTLNKIFTKTLFFRIHGGLKFSKTSVYSLTIYELLLKLLVKTENCSFQFIISIMSVTETVGFSVSMTPRHRKMIWDLRLFNVKCPLFRAHSCILTQHTWLKRAKIAHKVEILRKNLQQFFDILCL